MKKLLTLLLLSPLAFAEDTSEYQRITPKELKIQDNLERTILDYSTSDELGMNQMLAPVGWTEPIVSLEFELRGVVIAGVLGRYYECDSPLLSVLYFAARKKRTEVMPLQ